MNKLIIKSGFFILILGLLTGCSDTDSDQKYYQFTSDDLSHLYVDIDSFVYSGGIVHFSDTIAFLHNSIDTLFVEVKTRIYNERQTFDLVNSIVGISHMDFDEQTGFKYANVVLIKGGVTSDKYVGFQMLVDGCNDVKLDHPLDSANVLGKTYSNVYKLEFPENSPTKLKRLYFAKKYGFIKVETADGRKLERLE